MIKSMYIMPLYTRLKSLPGTTLVGYCRPIKPVFITLLVFVSFTIRAGSKKIPREISTASIVRFHFLFLRFMATVRLYCLWNCWWMVLTYGVSDRHLLLWANLCLLDAVAVKSRQLRTMPNTSLQDTVCSVLLGKKTLSDPLVRSPQLWFCTIHWNKN